MFTGIVETVARVTAVTPAVDSTVLHIATGFTDLALGESIAVNGVCLTVAQIEPAAAVFYASPETLARTNLGAVKLYAMVNLERAATLSTRLSGHLVQGHVDGAGRLLETVTKEDCFEQFYSVPAALARYCVEKGSVALNGVSLTINSMTDGPEQSVLRFTLIPHTWMHTNLSFMKSGDYANVEVDVMAKYVERLCQNLTPR